MARLSDQLINDIKQDVSLVRVAEAKGIQLKKHGKDYLGHCPFHNDRTPSFVISPESNLWNCLGACNCGGSVIDFVMKMEGISFRHAVELLKNDALSLAADAKPVKRATTKKLDSPLAANESDQALLQRVISFYHETLKQSPEAIDYLEKRGLNDPALIDQFKLGYANRSLGYRLPQKNRKEGAEIRGQLQQIGIIRDSGHEHFNGSLVIPVINESNEITEVYGRKLLENLRKGTPKHLYLPGEHQGVFNPSSFSCQEVILCESLIDALTFWRWGFKNVTTSYGIAGFTSDLLKAFKNSDIKRVLIAYDRDEAGNNATLEVAEKLQKLGIECYRILFPKGMDVNEYALKMTPARKSLELVIRKAEWLGQGIDPRTQEKPTTAAKEKEPAKVEKSSVSALIDEAEKTASLLAADLVAEESETPLPATPLPTATSEDIPCKATEHETTISLGDRSYRVRGLKKNTSYDHLKINLMASNDNGFHNDTLDLYSAKQRITFINQACVELGVQDEVIKKDLGKVLLKLEELQAQQIKDALEVEPEEKPISNEEREAALDLLKDPNLMERILNDFNKAGVVGEETNKLVGYLAGTSRRLDNPLAVVVQSSSAAGKSSLMDAVLNFMPEEERIEYSAMTGQSLFYMGETHLKNKILAIAEEEGATNASYALKLLQSEGEVTIASTGKDANTGNLVTQEYRVEGPTQLFMTTTAIDIDEELMNRCLVLSVDEGREQTRLIHQAQRQKRTLQGLQHKREKQLIVQLHRNAQRLIKPYQIINPYADQLTFLDDKTRTRRDHEKYLTLIDAIALLHQYQREVKQHHFNGEAQDYIEVTLEDIEMANQLAHKVLGRTLDELPPQTRKLLRLIETMVVDQCKAQSLDKSDYRFSRKMIREVTQWGNTQLKLHCKRLEEMEYLLVHRGGRGQSFEYELIYNGEGEQGENFLLGLINTDQMQHYDEKKSGVNGKRSGASRPQVAPKSVGGRVDGNGLQPNNHAVCDDEGLAAFENAPLEHPNIYTPYRNDDPYLLAAEPGT